MIDLLLLAVLGVVVWLVSADGPWGAGITFVTVLIGGLIAMNFFEPLAGMLSSVVILSPEWPVRWDIIAFWGIFSLSVFLLKAIGEKLLPAYAELSPPVYQGAKWGFAVLTGYVFTAIVCTTLHMAPLPREFLGFTPESRNLFGIAPDRHWLGFTQYASEKSLNRIRTDGLPAYFDGAVFPSNPGDARTAQVWSSFPIRYGARRQQYGSGGVAQTAPAATSAPPGPRRGSRSPGAGTGGF
ncbi:MAG TPA: CvpA family protein [Planctomicrobium sp.]|nr:CvpA family protein [Planctomicrobium sp.]